MKSFACGCVCESVACVCVCAISSRTRYPTKAAKLEAFWAENTQPSPNVNDVVSFHVRSPGLHKKVCVVCGAFASARCSCAAKFRSKRACVCGTCGKIAESDPLKKAASLVCACGSAGNFGCKWHVRHIQLRELQEMYDLLKLQDPDLAENVTIECLRVHKPYYVKKPDVHSCLCTCVLCCSR